MFSNMGMQNFRLKKGLVLMFTKILLFMMVSTAYTIVN